MFTVISNVMMLTNCTEQSQSEEIRVATRAELKQQSRENILTAAADMIRQQGIEGANVNDVMARAGLTRGSFYAHFANKDELVEMAFRQAMQQGRDYLFHNLKPADPAAITQVGKRYCAAVNTKKPSYKTDCVMAALGSSIGLADDNKSIKAAFAEELELSATEIAKLLHGQSNNEQSARSQSLTVLSTLVGSVILAKACGDSPLRQEILAACQQHLAES